MLITDELDDDYRGYAAYGWQTGSPLEKKKQLANDELKKTITSTITEITKMADQKKSCTGNAGIQYSMQKIDNSLYEIDNQLQTLKSAGVYPANLKLTGIKLNQLTGVNDFIEHAMRHNKKYGLAFEGYIVDQSGSCFSPVKISDKGIYILGSNNMYISFLPYIYLAQNYKWLDGSPCVHEDDIALSEKCNNPIFENDTDSLG